MKKSRLYRYVEINGWLFVTPFIIIFLVFNVYPLFYSISLSMTDYKGFGDAIFIGMQNFRLLLNDAIFKRAIFNTLYIWIVCFIFQVIVALVLSAIITNSRIKGKRIWMALYFFPNLVSSAIIGMVFALLFSKDVGLVNNFLKSVGVMNESFPWLGGQWTARGLVSFIVFIQFYGVFIMYMTATMSNIPRELYDAGKVDGLSDTQCFFKITLPLMRPILYFIFVTSIVGGMQIFEQPFLLTGGGPNNTTTTLMIYVYRQAFSYFNYGYAAAVGVYALVIVIIGVLIVTAFNRYYEKKYI